MNKNEFEKDSEIDIENLEVEACLQPELYFKYSSLTQKARKKYEIYKFKLSVKEAELARRARGKPAAFNITKVTDNAIREAVTTHVEYKIAYKRMINARYEADLLNKAQESMEQRKRMLELLVQLHGREYFSGPSTPHSPDYFWNKVKKKKGEKTNEKMIKQSRKRKKGSRE
ncbi:MAG: hypothetical protein ACTSO3_01390 [Candidatus Heimdallarchaeaceae archaeon]